MCIRDSHAEAIPGYVIDDAYTDPTSLGTYMEWVDSNTLKVRQPGGTPTVNVKFIPEDRTHIATLYITNPAGGTASVNNMNTVDPAITTNGSSTLIQTGDVLNVKVTPTHYATVTVVMGESSQTMNITNPVMMDDYINVLPGDAEVYVTFSDQPIEDPLLILNVKGEAGSGSADLTVDSTFISNVTANTPSANSYTTSVVKGDQVEITVKPATGYIATVTFSDRSGTYAPVLNGDGSSTYTFPMPDLTSLIVDVEFTEGEPVRRSINVVPLLRMPDGSIVPVDTTIHGDAPVSYTHLRAHET